MSVLVPQIHYLPRYNCGSWNLECCHSLRRFSVENPKGLG